MSHRYVFLAYAAVMFAGAALAGCAGEEATKSPIGAGGATIPPGGMTISGSGGAAMPAAGTTAAASGSGGSTPTGGTMATAGTTATAGTMATGGTDATGGTMATGGTDATAGAGPTSGSGGGAPPAMGSCGPEINIPAATLGNLGAMAMNGPWTPMHVESTGPTGASWIFYPADLGKDGLKHPVFQWGPGAGTGPRDYLEHLNLIASHGIVVIAQPSTNSGKQALDWILMENEKSGSMWFGKLDPNRVARGGHSMGALQSMSQAEDPRLKATVLVCGGAGGGGGAANITYPSIFLGATGESGTANFRGDYAEVKGLSVFVTHTDSDHFYCARANMGPWVAFLRWHLCGEEAKWKKEFMAGGAYCGGMWEACMSKMF